MEKRVLVIYYTQSGQLEEIVDNFTLPFAEDADIRLDKVRVYPQNDFPFPWTSSRFFDVMPESVLCIPDKLDDFQIPATRYDLIIFAYQPWYLSPSIPATSILHDERFTRLLPGTQVVTLIGSRNMWLNAQEKIRKMLQKHQARLVGNVVLADRHNNFISAITILYWMLSGKKDQYLGIFPKPGVSDHDIRSVERHGHTVIRHLKTGNPEGLQADLVREKALEVKSNLMFIESRAGRLFLIWANLISKRKNRSLWLIIFKYYLIFALFLVAPIVLTLNFIFFRPFSMRRINRKKKYYLGLKERADVQ